ncbi:MAG: hypothetical protein ACTS3R_04490 [Inquilinaceae bacterium]
MSSDDKALESKQKNRNMGKTRVELDDGQTGREDQRTEHQRTKDDAPFDAWLEHKLHDMYDSVVKEPVPPELMDLINKHSKP